MGNTEPFTNKRISTSVERADCNGIEVMDEELLEKASGYAVERGLLLRRRLGFGIHGIVFEAEDQRNRGRLAVKLLNDADAFARECAVYRRLMEHSIVEICGFNVPQFLRADDRWLAIEMTMVARPFVLDFAAAYVDWQPQFSSDALIQWEEDKREQFDEHWQTVQTILAALRDLGIYQTDVSPSNIGFPET